MQELNGIKIKFIYKYPWLPGGREIFEPKVRIDTELDEERVEDQTIYFEKMFEHYFSTYPHLRDRIIKIFYDALNKLEEGITPSEDEFNIIVYYMVKTLLAAFNNRVLDNHVANFMSKIYYQKIMTENDGNLFKLANHMHIICHYEPVPKKIDNVPYPYWVEFQSYLPASSLIKDPSWSIINRRIDRGKVYLLKDNLVRLLQEKIRRELIPERVGEMDEFLTTLKNISVLSEIIEAIEQKIQLFNIERNKFKKDHNGFKKDQDDSFFEGSEKPSSELFPPCIKFILEKALDGENLAHSERLHIAFFFANTNYSVEETVDVFRTVPDFDENIARYNVEFSRGIGGKGKKYRVYSCDKLKTQHMCKAADSVYGDEICSKGVKKKSDTDYHLIKSPMDYIFWKRVYFSRKNRSKESTKEST